jgi:transposase
METTKLRQKVDFTNNNIFVGMDVHQRSWNVSIFLEQTFVRSFTQPPSVDVITHLLRRDYPGANYLCGYESGYSGFWIQRKFKQQGIPCQVLHAADIPQTIKQKLMKRDPVDSKKIGKALASQNTNSIYVPDEESERDRSLIRYRERLLKDITRCKNRIRGILNQFGIDLPEKFEKGWSSKFIHWLKETEQVQGSARITLNYMIEQMVLLRSMLLKVNKDIRVLQYSQKYKQRLLWLVSIPGIGPLTAITLLTELIDIRRFSSFRHLNSFVGLYPMEHSTGDDEHKGCIMIRHNKHLRKILVEDSWVAIRHDPALTLSFNQLNLRMTSKRAIVKIARKLLSRIRYVLINETIYTNGIVK